MSSVTAALATTNDQWLLIILHGDRYWDIQCEYLVPWPTEYPAFDTFQNMYCDDGMMKNTHDAPKAPERLLMERLFKIENESNDEDYCENLWNGLKENVAAAGGFQENSETSGNLHGYPKAIHAILHTSINVVW